MHYVILQSAGDTAGERVEFADLQATVERLAGRPCPFLARELSRTGRCFVASAKGSLARERYGRGFVVAVRSE